ncbi:DUF4260 domain-containing protein [Paenimyroides aestuarii]|uniref:DUF4260 domain-containing protein n=1 Tax=Paenimyroides aestuarii TaxID=2968490 RepID=A0ABY5NVB8_9FLAO|nr:DUF4260 domain-containing protein [Paenimyroides aestuarii]UUV22443.1 DUF4260 domain-containing protein [Paenimyroides aestuarii]
MDQAKMNNILKGEELAQFALSIFLFSQLEFSWWLFPACLLLPDISMFGYLINPRTGAFVYNLFHHKLIAITLLIIGFWFNQPAVSLAGIVLFGHSAMDRMFGYGLKFDDHFKHTHLGWIGSKNN